MADAGYVTKTYPLGKADLYAVFLERGLQLVREGGLSSLLTMRGWMFIQQFAKLRQMLLEKGWSSPWIQTAGWRECATSCSAAAPSSSS